MGTAANELSKYNLESIAKAPSIIFTGYAEAEAIYTSPPSNSSVVSFPYALTGGVDSYVILLTTINAGYAYVVERLTDRNGNFSGFSCITQYEGTVMYLVSKIGTRPLI